MTRSISYSISRRTLRNGKKMFSRIQCVSRKVVEKPKPLIAKQPFLERRPFSVAKKPDLRKSLNENEKILILSNQNMRCNMCQDRLLIHPFTKRKLFDFDHIIPRSKNGSTEVKNMQALCKNCHAVKTAWDLS